MKSLVEIKIPEDYIICCAVNQNGEDKLFSDEIIAFLFSTMNSKWLPLVAYKITFPEDTGEERLYIAYDPRIIDRSRINQMDGEIMNFFHTNLPTVKMEMGGKVKYKIRSRFSTKESANRYSTSIAPSASSSREEYHESDNMRGFDPASEDDMDDNGMSRFMEVNDEEGWD